MPKRTSLKRRVYRTPNLSIKVHGPLDDSIAEPILGVRLLDQTKLYMRATKTGRSAEYGLFISTPWRRNYHLVGYLEHDKDRIRSGFEDFGERIEKGKYHINVGDFSFVFEPKLSQIVIFDW